MIVFGFFLTTLGACDALTGITGSVSSRSQLVRGLIGCALIPVALLIVCADGPLKTRFCAAAVIGALTAVWLIARFASDLDRRGKVHKDQASTLTQDRARSTWDRNDASRILLFISLGGFTLFACAGLWKAVTASEVFESWLTGNPFFRNDVWTGDVVALGFGLILVIATTSNAVVRLILTVVLDDVNRPEASLKGGRVIGPMERMLLAAFITAGSLEAAALLVAIKSLLRFPELRSNDEQPNGEVTELTEYVVVGSLASWIVTAIWTAPLAIAISYARASGT
jgi:hypothetical protein